MAMQRKAILAAIFFIGASCARAAHGTQTGTGDTEHFHQPSCFAGQVRVNGKRLAFRSFEILEPNQNGSCCGKFVRKGKTDQHGHFLIEPLDAGQYYAKFNNRSNVEVVGFSVLHSYDKCDAGHLEIKFLADGRNTVQEYVDLDVDLSDCNPEEAYCFRR